MWFGEVSLICGLETQLEKVRWRHCKMAIDMVILCVWSFICKEAMVIFEYGIFPSKGHAYLLREVTHNPRHSFVCALKKKLKEEYLLLRTKFHTRKMSMLFLRMKSRTQIEKASRSPYEATRTHREGKSFSV